MTEQNALAVPTIISQISKERFRRRLLIFSRLMAFALIFVILYIGINFNTNALRVSQNPCGFCGLYYGKSCTQVYYDPASKISVKDYLETIALDNAKVSPELKDYINHSFSINMTELSNIYKNLSKNYSN